MKLKSVVFGALLCAVGVWAQAPNSAAAASPASIASTPKVGIINIQQAISETAEAKRDAAALRARFQPKQTELETASKDVQSLQQKLQDGGNTLSPEAKAELTRSIERKQRDLNNSAEEAQTDYNNAQQEIVNRIGGKMIQVVNSYAKQNGYSMILDAQAVVFADNAINVTQEIVKAYERQYPVTASAAPTTGAPATGARPSSLLGNTTPRTGTPTTSPNRPH